MTMEQFDGMLSVFHTSTNDVIREAHNAFTSLKAQQMACDQAIGLLKKEFDKLAHQPDMKLTIRDSYIQDDKDPIEVDVYVCDDDLDAIAPQLCEVIQHRKSEITVQLKKMEETWQARFKDITGQYY